jgi:hypothetical protein
MLMSDSHEEKNYVELNGWMLPIHNIQHYDSRYPKDLYISPTEEYAVFVHTQREIRMNTEVGSIAVFTDKENPHILENIHNMSCTIYFKKQDIKWLSAKMFTLNYISTKHGVGIILVDLKTKSFAYIMPIDKTYAISITNSNKNSLTIESWKSTNNIKPLLICKEVVFSDLDWINFPLSWEKLENLNKTNCLIFQ